MSGAIPLLPLDPLIFTFLYRHIIKGKAGTMIQTTYLHTAGVAVAGVEARLREYISL
jgi:hypothetical protein